MGYNNVNIMNLHSSLRSHFSLSVITVIKQSKKETKNRETDGKKKKNGPIGTKLPLKNIFRNIFLVSELNFYIKFYMKGSFNYSGTFNIR